MSKRQSIADFIRKNADLKSANKSSEIKRLHRSYSKEFGTGAESSVRATFYRLLKTQTAAKKPKKKPRRNKPKPIKKNGPKPRRSSQSLAYQLRAWLDNGEDLAKQVERLESNKKDLTILDKVRKLLKKSSK